MADPAYAFQVGVADALLADAGVTGLVGQNVLSPLSAENIDYPLVEIGNDQFSRAADDQCYDVLSQIDVWGDALLAIKQIGAAVSQVLAPDFSDTPLQVTGHRVISATFHASKYMIEADETDPQHRVGHGVLQFRFQLVPTA